MQLEYNYSATYLCNYLTNFNIRVVFHIILFVMRDLISQLEIYLNSFLLGHGLLSVKQISNKI